MYSLLHFAVKREILHKKRANAKILLTFCNGVQQGSNFSPRLFWLYVIQLIDRLIVLSDCYMNDMCYKSCNVCRRLCLLAPTLSKM